MSIAPDLARASARPPFIRDRFTWIAYLLLGYFSFLQTLMGPIMPFLRAELNLSYVAGSLHLSAVAAGMVAGGLTGDRLLRRISYKTALWGGAAGMALGMLGLMLGGHIIVTMLAAVLMGVLGTFLLIGQQAALAHQHGPFRAVAFTEANIVASLGAMLAPPIVGIAVSVGIGWRAAPALAMLLLGILLLSEGRRPVPEPAHTGAARTGHQPLPRRFWVFWLVACLGVAVEWSIGFWGADFMHTIAGLPLELAVSAMGVYFLAMLLGRVAGSLLVRRYTPAMLLGGALAVALAGVALFWQASYITFTLAGLAIAGLGVGNLFPLSLAAAVETAPLQTAAASARMTLAGGTAILSAPLALGGLADTIGLGGAFAIVPLIIAAAFVAIIVGRR